MIQSQIYPLFELVLIIQILKIQQQIILMLNPPQLSFQRSEGPQFSFSLSVCMSVCFFIKFLPLNKYRHERERRQDRGRD